MSNTDLARCDVPSDWISDFSQCLYEWQGLEAAGIAFLVAALTAAFLWHQIGQTERLEQRRLARQHRAKRSLMTHALSTATQFAERSIKALSEARRLLKANKRLLGNWTPPVFPSEVVQSLSEFLETSDDEPVNALVGELISQLQVHNARLVSMVSDEDTYRIGVALNIADYQIQAAKVRQLCGALFPYCRIETDTVPSSLERSEVASHLEFNDAGDDDPDFEKRLELFKSVNKPWWPRQNG